GIRPDFVERIREGGGPLAGCGADAARQPICALQPGDGAEPDRTDGGSGKRVCRPERDHCQAEREEERADRTAQVSVRAARLSFPEMQRHLRRCETPRWPPERRNKPRSAIEAPESPHEKHRPRERP